MLEFGGMLKLAIAIIVEEVIERGDNGKDIRRNIGVQQSGKRATEDTLGKGSHINSWGEEEQQRWLEDCRSLANRKHMQH